MTATIAPTAELSALEQAHGSPLGTDSDAPSPGPATDAPPYEALERAVLPALERSPALVSFSGGRDSSLVLAAAVTAARRHGLELPVPVTLRVAGAPAADEAEWQELVIGHLGLDDWIRVPITDELDLVGPVAAAGIERHGPMYPANAHLTVPMAEHARGGSLTIGFGGDHLLAPRRWSTRADILARRRRPARAELRGVVLGAAPARVRRALLRRRYGVPELPWLSAQAHAELLAADVDQHTEPPRYDEYVDWVVRRRHVTVAVRSIAKLAADAAVQLHVPLLDEGFLAALKGFGGRHGPGTRTAAMYAIAGDHLPRALIERPTKAYFHEAFFGAESRRFAAAWDGAGVDERLVDADRLRATWTGEVPDFRSSLLLQAAARSA